MRRLKGTVVKHSMQKTAVIRVDRLLKHPKYQKYYRVSKKYKAHDAADDTRPGDIVIIQESRPLSKGKRWVVVERVGRVSEAMDGDVGEETGKNEQP